MKINSLNSHLILTGIVFVLNLFSGYSQERITYKKVDTTELAMEIYRPSIQQADKKVPAIVFFFGGGWNSGNIHQFEPHAKYFSQRGLSCFLVDYRVRERHQTSPFESLKDAKSAIRYIRENAEILNIDPLRIVAAGGSAGGHLAAATALIEDYNEDSDDTSIDCKPNALLLYNPVIDNGPGGYGFERIREEYKRFSPLHNIKQGAPPTIIFLGKEDNLIPVVTAEYYKMVMEKVGGRCELSLFEGEGHGFFNYRNLGNYEKTLRESEDFLQSLGYLEKEPIVGIE